MKTIPFKLIKTVCLITGLALFSFNSFAALPEPVALTLGGLSADATTIGSIILGVVAVIVGFKLLRRAA